MTEQDLKLYRRTLVTYPCLAGRDKQTARRVIRTAEAWIAAIDDLYIRELFKLKYTNGLTHNRIAHRLGSTEAAVKMTMRRYLRKK